MCLRSRPERFPTKVGCTFGRRQDLPLFSEVRRDPILLPESFCPLRPRTLAASPGSVIRDVLLSFHYTTAAKCRQVFCAPGKYIYRYSTVGANCVRPWGCKSYGHCSKKRKRRLCTLYLPAEIAKKHCRQMILQSLLKGATNTRGNKIVPPSLCVTL